MEQNDFFHAQMPNEYASPSPDSPSSSTDDLMMQMCASLMEKMNEYQEGLKENICSIVSQWMNERAEEEARQGDLLSNMVVNPNDMNLEGGVQVESIPCFDEEEHEPQKCQEADPRIEMDVANPPSTFESNGVLPSASHSDNLDDSMTCSCDELSICVDCYEGKYPLLVEFHRRQLKELQPANDDVVLGADTMDEATSRGDTHVEHHSTSLEKNEEVEEKEVTGLPSSIGEKDQETESSLLLEQEVSKAFIRDMVQQSQPKDDEQNGQHPTPVTHVPEEVHSEAESLTLPDALSLPEATEHEISKAECKVEAQLAQELESFSTSQLVHKSSQGIIFDPTLVTFSSSCNLGKKTFHELVQSVILDLFSMLEFNVPLLVALEPLPTYAKPSFNICIYKEACRPYTLLIETVVEQPVSSFRLLSHEDEYTSSEIGRAHV